MAWLGDIRTPPDHRRDLDRLDWPFQRNQALLDWSRTRLRGLQRNRLPTNRWVHCGRGNSLRTRSDNYNRRYRPRYNRLDETLRIPISILRRLHYQEQLPRLHDL